MSTFTLKLKAAGLFGLFLAGNAVASSYKPVVVCSYSSPEPTCTVDLVTAMSGSTHRSLEILDGRRLTVTAAYNLTSRAATPPEGLVGDTGDQNTLLPLNPRITSDLKIVRIKYQPGFATPTAVPGDLGWGGSFKGCISNKNAGPAVYPAEAKERLNKSELNFGKIGDCDFVVTSVVVALPSGWRAPKDPRPKQDYVMKQDPQLATFFDAGRSMAEHVGKTRENLGFLREVLTTRMKPAAEAYTRSVNEVLAALNFDPALPGDPRTATHFLVFEKARSLYVHGSVLGAVLNKNRSELNSKYIDSVQEGVAQIADAFGFNNGSKNLDPTASQESKTFGGPLSQGYAALMTAVDLALQDAIVGLPVDARSPEMRQMYDVQVRAQRIKAMVLRRDDSAASSEMDGLLTAWSDPAFLSALQRMSDFRVSAGETPSPLVAAYDLLLEASAALASFSGQVFPVPFGPNRP